MRPTSIAQMQEHISHFATPEGWARGLAFTPRPTDIFISPFAKCGTTWMQQIVHSLRSDGAMDFDEITRVTPWVEMAHDMGADPDAPQVAQPRAYKSHLDWHMIPKGGKYIVVFRDPLDAMVSFYRFFEGWWFESGSISLTEFAEYYLQRAEAKNYWSHTASWWDVRNRDDVLCICFEDMKTDLARTVHQVADFMDIHGAKTRQIATHQARFEFMKAHERQFDDHLIRETRDAACGLPPGGVASKVNRGKVGAEKAAITAQIEAAFAARWRETLGAQFGLTSYAALRQALND